MSRRDDLREKLGSAPVPDEPGAEERAWGVVRAAYAERTPVRPTYRARRLALAIAGGALLLAIGLSPAGAKVADVVRDVVGIGEEDARPALRSLPAAGELLVESEHGVWIVREDGSKRLLGDYREATWSPRGLFAAVTKGRELIVVEPDGGVRWTITAPAAVHDPRWSPSGFRIAYRSRDELRVVAGDGTGDRVLARRVAPAAPVWLAPRPATKLSPAGAARGTNLLAYLDRSGLPRTFDVDASRPAQPVSADLPRIHALKNGAVLSPQGGFGALVTRDGRRSRLEVLGGGERPTVFSGPGRITDPTWSPDGRWLLFGWPAADQWLFVDPERPRHVIAIDNISAQFDPGDTGSGEFPRVSGWVLPQR